MWVSGRIGCYVGRRITPGCPQWMTKRKIKQRLRGNIYCGRSTSKQLTRRGMRNMKGGNVKAESEHLASGNKLNKSAENRADWTLQPSFQLIWLLFWGCLWAGFVAFVCTKMYGFKLNSGAFCKHISISAITQNCLWFWSTRYDTFENFVSPFKYLHLVGFLSVALLCQICIKYTCLGRCILTIQARP